ncbi:MAG: MBOAT family protein [Verrucomicrobiaceae bacterium]|nr:MAG: MBOAT family protein [Verrucomicrobiaceae bacterium]
MNFAEIRFWVLLFTALAVLLAVRVVVLRIRCQATQTYDKLALLGVGLFLLEKVSTITFAIFLLVAVGTYWALVGIQRLPERRHSRTLWILVPLQFLPLLYYKYFGFLSREFGGADWEYLRDLAIPVGISFYTFQKVGFAVDTIKFGHKLPKFLDYLNFAAFFPQIVAGPIERRGDLLPQVQDFRFRWLPGEIVEGISYIILGLFLKCCLADNLAGIDFDDSTNNPFAIWVANLIFGFRIYYDFAGYSMVALGIARCLGVSLSLNFRSPYCSTSATEFWRRWHVTLSHWFRDYVYVPLGGGRVNYWFLNVLVVFLLSGIWHGAGWNFVLWGALHGAALILHRIFSKRFQLPAALGWMITMGFVSLTWLCFYETRTAVLFSKLQTLFDLRTYTFTTLKEAAMFWEGAQGLLLLFFGIFAGCVLALEWFSLRRGLEPYWHLRRPKILAALVILTVLLAPSENNGFIYFAF